MKYVISMNADSTEKLKMVVMLYMKAEEGGNARYLHRRHCVRRYGLQIKVVFATKTAVHKAHILTSWLLMDYSGYSRV